MQVSEIMHKGIITVQINDSIKRVASLMKNEDIGAVPVYKNERPVGFVTDRDIVISSIAQGHASEAPISHAMTSQIISINESEDIHKAAQLMREKQISRVLVVDNGETPVGMLSLHDIAKSIMDDALKSNALTDVKRS